MLNFWLSQTLAVKRAKVPNALPMRLFISFYFLHTYYYFYFLNKPFISEDLCIINRIQTTKTGISENLGVLNKLYMLSIMNNELYLTTINNSIQDNLSVAIWSGNQESQEKLSFSKKVRKSQEKLKKKHQILSVQIYQFPYIKSQRLVKD